ncbi:MAG: DUF1190 family protein [Serratia symbiotica]|nr:DUF1190 family protein [Serratia symbiotica]
MKRTKSINQEMFRKSWRSYPMAPLALAISAVFILAGCENSDKTVAMYQNADDCSRSNPSMREQCTTTHHKALKEAEKTAPKYATREECVAKFGDAQCTQTPVQAGVVAESQSSGSVWMPLMASYMMGRMMGGTGFAQQPLFTSQNAASPANGKFADATGKSYSVAIAGERTTTVPTTAMAPKPAVTHTITRGGFGKTVAKQNSMQRRSATSGSRSMGG